MAEGNSFKDYNGDGATTDFPIPFVYLDATDLVLEHPVGVIVGHTLPNATTIRANSAPASGTDNVRVRRETAKVNRKVDWQQGSNLPESDLDLSDQQFFYILQEIFDQIQQGITNGLSGISLAAVSSFWTTVIANTNLAGSISSLGGAQAVNSSIFKKGADVASAGALTVGADGNYFDVTGTTTITSINTVGIGSIIRLHFDGALTLTHNATDLVLPGGANITTAAGDEATFIEYATGDWRCLSYTRASGASVAGSVTNLFTTRGDTARAGVSGVPERVALAAENSVWESDGTDAAWSDAKKYATPAIRGLKLSNNGTDADHDIDITVGGCWSADFTEYISVAALTTKGDAAFVKGTNQGMLDTGAIAADTGYAIWAIKQDSTGDGDILMSLSYSAPTMPSGWTAKRLIGFVYTDSVANIIAFRQEGDVFYVYDDDTNDLVQLVNDSTITSLTRETVTTKLPPGSEILVHGLLTNTTTTDLGDARFWLIPTESTETVENAHALAYLLSTATPDVQGAQGSVILNDTGQFDYTAVETAGAATLEIRLRAVRMNRRSNP